MINSIQIENFLSHKDTYIQLHSGVNVFLGESDVGKSAIFRAINKIISNRPMGTDFIRWGQDNCTIGLDLSDNTLIEWIYEDKKAKYVLSQKEETIVFNAFGKKVPEEISIALNIEEINFQHQLTNAFLFQSSPGEVARYLNQIVNLDVIDTALYNINHRLKSEQNLLANRNADAKRIKEDLEQYDWLDEAERKLNTASKLEGDLNSLKTSLSGLNSLINSITAIKERSFKYEQITAFEGQINNLIDLDKKIDNLFDQYDDLKAFIDDIEKLNKIIKNSTEIIAAEPMLIKIGEIDNELEGLIEIERDLNYSMNNLLAHEQKIKRLKKQKKDLENKFNKLMPEVCPLCEQEIKK